MRSATQTNTGYSPFEILYGTKIRLPWEESKDIGVKENANNNIVEYMKAKEDYRRITEKLIKEKGRRGKRRKGKKKKKGEKEEKGKKK